MLSAAWSWVAGSVGDEYALLILGAGAAAQSRMWDWAGKHGWQANLYFSSCPDLGELRDVYRQALVFLQIDPILSGQGLRWAQASGAAIVGFERGPTAMITGPAGYLVSAGDARQLGAAILTLLVEEDLRQELRGKGFEQAHRYVRGDLPGTLADRFQATLAGQPGQQAP
jgi:glycosyltransferase involved in cell wall biosynthesis